MKSVDVVLLTLNSDRQLEACVASIYRSIPVKRLIVVDGGSTDRTLEIMGVFNRRFGNVEIICDRGTRATARQRGIESVTSEWFVFVDSDVVLCKDWYSKAWKQVDENVGAVWGIEVWSTIRSRKTLKLFLFVTRKIFDLRGGTHDTLIRTQALRGVRIPLKLHVFEDAYIKNWIEKVGYRVVACYNPFCVHYRPEEVWTLRGSLNLISDAIKFGSLRLIVPLVLAYGFYTVYSVYQMLTKKQT